jgi:16S rRNA (guanine527-N7)-methyltransferase
MEGCRWQLVRPMIVDSDFEQALRSAIADWPIALSPMAIEAMWGHFLMVVEKNRVMNLTRITEPGEAAVKHYADSLALAAWVQSTGIEVRTLLDVGTGPGFPAVPLAIARPDWSITAIDATRKKIEFLRHAASSLGLVNLTLEHAHASHWKTERQFDLVAFRALAKIGDAVELCGRFVRRGGRLVAYKSASLPPDEAGSLLRLASQNRFREAEKFTYSLPFPAAQLNRALYILREG